MKKEIVLFVFLLICNAIIISAQTKHYVWAKSGLILRDQPSFTSKKIETIPYGTLIKEQIYVDNYMQSDSLLIFSHPTEKKNRFYVKGNWQAVSFENKTGYIFDAFVSSMHPIKKENSIEEYIRTNYKRLDSVGTNDHDYIITYNKGCSYKSDGYEGGGNTYIYFIDRTFNDGYLLLNYFEQIPKTDELKLSYSVELECSPNEMQCITEEGASWIILISERNGLLVIMTGGSC